MNTIRRFGKTLILLFSLTINSTPTFRTMLQLIETQRTPYTSEFMSLNAAENLLFTLHLEKGDLASEEDAVRQLQYIDTDIRFAKVIQTLIKLLSTNLERVTNNLLTDTKEYLEEKAKIPANDIDKLQTMVENYLFAISSWADTFNIQALKNESEKIVTFLYMFHLASIENTKEGYMALSITLYTLHQYSKYGFFSLHALPTFYPEILTMFLQMLRKPMNNHSLISLLSETTQILSSELFHLALPNKQKQNNIPKRNLILDSSIAAHWQTIQETTRHNNEHSRIYVILNAAKITLNLYDKNQNKHAQQWWKSLSHSWQSFYTCSYTCFNELDWCKDCTFWCCLVPVVGILILIAVLQHNYNVAASLTEVLLE